MSRIHFFRDTIAVLSIFSISYTCSVYGFNDAQICQVGRMGIDSRSFSQFDIVLESNGVTDQISSYKNCKRTGYQTNYFYDLASVTKSLATGFVVAYLVNQKVLSYESSIGQFLAEISESPLAPDRYLLRMKERNDYHGELLLGDFLLDSAKIKNDQSSKYEITDILFARAKAKFLSKYPRRGPVGVFDASGNQWIEFVERGLLGEIPPVGQPLGVSGYSSSNGGGNFSVTYEHQTLTRFNQQSKLKSIFSEIKVSDLLSHRAGMPQSFADVPGGYWKVIYRLLEEYQEETWPTGVSRDESVYTDTDYILLSLLVEVATGKKFDEVFDEALQSTGLATGKTLSGIGYLTSGQRKPNDPFASATYTDVVYGHAGLFGSAQGVHSLLKAWLKLAQKEWSSSEKICRGAFCRSLRDTGGGSGDGKFGLGFDLASPLSSSARGSYFKPGQSLCHVGSSGSSVCMKPNWKNLEKSTISIVLTNRSELNGVGQGHDEFHNGYNRKGSKDVQALRRAAANALSIK